MPYTGYYTNDELKKKLGNTIASNFDEGLLTSARRYGDDNVDSGTQRTPQYQDAEDPNVKHGWTPTDPYYGESRGISMAIAGAWLHSTQINVSIQMLREYQQALTDIDRLLKRLIALGVVQKTGRFSTDEFVTDVLNPYTGTIVTGLNGIVRRNRMFNLEDYIYRL